MNRTIRHVLIALATTSLIACGGSGDDNSSSVDNNNTSNNGNDNQQGGDQNNLLGPAQFVLAECGSTTVSNQDASNTVATLIALNQLVEGQLLQNDPVSDFDLWEITLEPGNYHLVADYLPASGERVALGLEINSLTAEGEERIVRSNEPGYDGRTYSYQEIDTQTTLTLKVEPVFNQVMSYTMGIYANDSAVPSPRLTRCFPTTRMSLNETRSFELSALRDNDDYRWFRMTLDAGVYNLDASTFAAERSSLAFAFYLFQRFGNDETKSLITIANVLDTSLISTGQFTVLNDGDVWIRANTSTDDRVEFTVRQ